MNNNPTALLPTTKAARKAEIAQLKRLRQTVAECFPRGMPEEHRLQFEATQTRIVALIAADRTGR